MGPAPTLDESAVNKAASSVSQETVAGWRRENSPGNGLAVVQTDVSVRALPKAKPKTRIYKQVVCWGGDPRNYLRGMGSEAKKKREEPVVWPPAKRRKGGQPGIQKAVLEGHKTSNPL